MRKQLVEVKTRYKAKKVCYWASIIIKVCNGYICFESIADYNQWKNQK